MCGNHFGYLPICFPIWLEDPIQASAKTDPFFPERSLHLRACVPVTLETSYVFTEIKPLRGNTDARCWRIVQRESDKGRKGGLGTKQKPMPRTHSSLLSLSESTAFLRALFLMSSLVSRFVLLLWLAFWKNQDALMCVEGRLSSSSTCIPSPPITSSAVLLIDMLPEPGMVWVLRPSCGTHLWL